MELSEEQINKLSEIFNNAFKQIEFRSPSKSLLNTLSSSANFILTISAASLLWVLNSVSEFKILNMLPYKWLYLSIIISFSLSTLLLTYFRIKLLFYMLTSDSNKDTLFKTITEFEAKAKNISPDEVLVVVEKRLTNFLKTYNLISDVLKTNIYTLVIGIVVYSVGLILSAIYFIKYFVTYIG